MSPTVRLDFWMHPVYGPRWSIVRDGELTLLTYATEQQAREACKRWGWTLAEDDDDAVFGGDGHADRG